MGRAPIKPPPSLQASCLQSPVGRTMLTDCRNQSCNDDVFIAVRKILAQIPTVITRPGAGNLPWEALCKRSHARRTAMTMC